MTIDAELIQKLQRQRLRLGEMAAPGTPVEAEAEAEAPAAPTAAVTTAPNSPAADELRLSSGGTVRERRRTFEGRQDSTTKESPASSEAKAECSTDASSAPLSPEEPLLSGSSSSRATPESSCSSSGVQGEEVPCERIFCWDVPERPAASEGLQPVQLAGCMARATEQHQQRQLLQKLRQKRLEGQLEALHAAAGGRGSSSASLESSEALVTASSLAAAAQRRLADQSANQRGRATGALPPGGARETTRSASASARSLCPVRDLSPVDELRAMAWVPPRRARAAGAQGAAASLSPPPRPEASQTRGTERSSPRLGDSSGSLQPPRRQRSPNSPPAAAKAAPAPQLGEGPMCAAPGASHLNADAQWQLDRLSQELLAESRRCRESSRTCMARAEALKNQAEALQNEVKRQREATLRARQAATQRRPTRRASPPATWKLTSAWA
eukprot:TRINITY_DN33025_c0_g1_i1.p1 TRINITY_DN33025_c0_g1~~TRINITY_DN33025_c0_g1_i1.p1  ORF type:complete len:442 (+),score=95.61 TRINITY_DN33025_c0_g1_i1:21-1346(+)